MAQAPRYRTHGCGELRASHAGARVRLAGWVARCRDHGRLVFLDLRDASGTAQLVVERDAGAFEAARELRPEAVVRAEGRVVARPAERRSPSLASGDVEVALDLLETLGACDPLPFPVHGDAEPPEELRLRYRFLDLRRRRMRRNLELRARLVGELRRRLTERGFLEIHTPILTASSPEGARDFLVPSRVHPGEFYALPQAPQMFKQLLMAAGFERYFQIAPCFRDEDARADRCPGEFYQLDVELAFATEEDVFAELEPVLHGVFEELGDARVPPPPFPRLRYADALERYGTDKPDLRNPLELVDVTARFADSRFRVFADAVARGERVRAVRAPGAAARPRSFFDAARDWAHALGAPGLAYLALGDAPRGPLGRLPAGELDALARDVGAERGDAVFFACARPRESGRIGAGLLARLGEALGLVERDAFRFCWITDYPMFERDPETGRIGFSHNPFSAAQGGLDALDRHDPLEVRAHQYDLVCNGVELSSGAIRNHRADAMLRAFAIAGYTPDQVRARFGALLEAFRFGTPPHGGLAPGIDRMAMLLAGERSVREVIAFPLAQNARDLLMNAPAPVPDGRLRELHLRRAGAGPVD